MNETETHIGIIRLVIRSLAGAMFLGLVGTIYLVVIKSDPALIAVVSGLTGTALGMVGSVLNNTKTSPENNSTKI